MKPDGKISAIASNVIKSRRNKCERDVMNIRLKSLWRDFNGKFLC
jgi:hypothetical protein